MKTHILSLLPEETEDIFQINSIPKFRVRQLFNWLYQNSVSDLEQMINLPNQLKHQFVEMFDFRLPEIVVRETSADGTSKFLLQLSDGNKVEMVLIPHLEKNTLCISSQVGCSRGCSFCATAGLGLTRNLRIEEIVGQVFLAKRFLGAKKLTNIVFMGMGEPLDNLPNVLKAVRIFQNDRCFNLSPRRITISTSGVIPGIQILAESGLKVKLAVSLNAAIQEKREKLMPIAKIYPLPELKKSLLDFRKKSAFRITFEYVMIRNFNMGEDDVKAILKFLGDISCKLNLIKWNEVEHLSFQSPTVEEINKFKEKLEKLSSAVTFRNSRGADISAACGQLAGKSTARQNELLKN